MIMDGKTMSFHVVGLEVEGKAVSTDVPAVIHEDRTLVPVHVIRNMGITVGWEEATREVTIATGKKTVVMKIDSPIAIMDGEAVRLPSDVPPKIITYQNSGRTMVPIAFLRQLGLTVNWKEKTRTVSVEKPIEEEPIEEEPVEEKPVITKAIKDVTVNFPVSGTEIRIKTGEELRFTELLLKEQRPYRLVFDFEDTKFDFTNKGKLQSNGTLQLVVNNNGIGSIRAAQFKTDPFITRVTIEVEEITPYEVFYDSSTGEMVIQIEGLSIEEPLYYRNTFSNSSRLELRADEITEYHFSVSDYGRTLHISVPKNHIELPISTIEVKDQFLEEINIGESSNGKEYNLEIRLQEDVNYLCLHPVKSKEYFIQFNLGGNTNKDPLIVIDPGHGGTSPGATSPINQIVEKNIVLDISQRLNNLLTDAGYRTYMTRVNDSTVSLADRAGVANQLQADLFVSIHANAASNSSIHGVENLYYPSEKNPNDFRDNKKLAQTFQNEMVKRLGVHNRGIVPRDELYVIRETNMPAVLSEVGFLTNPEEAAKLATAEYRQQIAEAIYHSILRYFQGI